METAMALSLVVVIGLSALMIDGIGRMRRRTRYPYQQRVSTRQLRTTDKHKIGRAA